MSGAMIVIVKVTDSDSFTDRINLLTNNKVGYN